MLGGYWDLVRQRAPLVVHVPDVHLCRLLLLAVQRHDAARDGALQVGVSGRTSPERTYVWSPAICLPVGLALAWYGTVDSSASALACRSGPSPTCGTTPERSSHRSAMPPCSSWWSSARIRRPSSRARRSRPDGADQLPAPQCDHVVVFLGWGFGLAGRFDYADQLSSSLQSGCFSSSSVRSGCHVIASVRLSGCGDR